MKMYVLHWVFYESANKCSDITYKMIGEVHVGVVLLSSTIPYYVIHSPRIYGFKYYNLTKLNIYF